MNYELKDKINATKEFITELESKSWQEIDYLQTQINNLADGTTNDKLRQLCKNLLTSYYIFVGGVETLESEPQHMLIDTVEEPKVEIQQEPDVIEQVVSDPAEEFNSVNIEVVPEAGEPFEYFVDFDDPIGEPLSDEDLYNN